MVSRKNRVLVLVAVAELLAMSLWFSATAAAPELAAEWGLTDAETAWLTDRDSRGSIGTREAFRARDATRSPL